MALLSIFKKRSAIPAAKQVDVPSESTSLKEKNHARDLDLTNPEDWQFITNPMGRKIAVSKATAMKLAPWYAAISARAKDIASLPQHVYRRDGKRKDIALDSDQYFLLHTEPHPEMSLYDFKYALLAYKYGHGDGFAWVERHPRSGRPKAYHFRYPWEMHPFREGNSRTSPLLYKDYVINEVLDPVDVIHLKNGHAPGDRGVSVVSLAKDSLRQGLASDIFASKFYENGTHLSGWVEFPNWFKEGQLPKFKEGLKQEVVGIENTGEPLILQGGGKYHDLGMKLSDAEFILSRNFTTEEVCRWLDIPPSRIYASKNQNSTWENDMLRYRAHSILPELVQYEQEFDRKVFQFIEDGNLYLKNEIKGFMRADLKTQNEYYKTGLFYGFLRKDEVRALEDLNPLPEELGERTYTQSSMIPDSRFDEYIDAIIAGKIKSIQSDKSDEQKKFLNGSEKVGPPAGEFTAGIRPN